MTLAVDQQFRYTRYTWQETFSLLINRSKRTGVQVVHAAPHQGRRITIHIDIQTKEGNRLVGDRIAVLLGRSSDWYKYRLNVYAEQFEGIQWIVAGTHDTCVSVPVWCVEEEKLYNVHETRISFTDLLQKYDRLRFTEFGHKLILGGMICNIPEAKTVAATLKRSARFALEADVRKHTHRKKGRPLHLGDVVSNH